MTRHRSRVTTLLALLAAGCAVLTACGSVPAATPPASAQPVATPTVDTAPVPAALASVPSSPTSPVQTSDGPTSPAETSPASEDHTTALPFTGGDLRACALITREQAATALGQDPGPGQLNATQSATTICLFTAGKSFLEVALTPTNGKAAYDRARAKAQTAAPAALLDLPSLGDTAFEFAHGSQATIAIEKHNIYVVVGLNLDGATTPPKTQIMALATAAASQI
jgi:hypothetical protein